MNPADKKIATDVTTPPKPAGMKIGETAMVELRMGGRNAEKVTVDKEMVERMFTPYKPPKGVLPSNHKFKMALDEADVTDMMGDSYLLSIIGDAFSQGYAFPGFTLLAQWAQISEFRKPSETLAREVVRKWIRIQAAGDESKAEKVKTILNETEKLNLKARIRELVEKDGLFGRAQLFFDLGDDYDDKQELTSELVESKLKVNTEKRLKRLTVIEPVWSYPNQYNSNNPLDPTFYRPTSWFVMGKEIHSSRLATFITRQVPDILKPAYAFAGLSLSQMMKPYVDNWLRTRQSVSDLVASFTVWTLKTNLSSILNGGAAADLLNRLEVFNVGRDNHGVNAIDKESEDFSNVSVPLGGLDHLLAQSQEQMCAPTGIPLVYLTGITPSGLNASSEGEISVFQDGNASIQEILTPIIQKVLNLIQLSLFNEIDPDITFEWIPLKTMTPKEKAEIRAVDAQADATYVDSGVLSNEEVRERIAHDPDSLYPGLDLNATPQPPDESEGEIDPDKDLLNPLAGNGDDQQV